MLRFQARILQTVIMPSEWRPVWTITLVPHDASPLLHSPVHNVSQLPAHFSYPVNYIGADQYIIRTFITSWHTRNWSQNWIIISPNIMWAGSVNCWYVTLVGVMNSTIVWQALAIRGSCGEIIEPVISITHFSHGPGILQTRVWGSHRTSEDCLFLVLSVVRRSNKIKRPELASY